MAYYRIHGKHEGEHDWTPLAELSVESGNTIRHAKKVKRALMAEGWDRIVILHALTHSDPGVAMQEARRAEA